jgi:Ca2+/H+ antiporter, TMEM165/GDT1 family
MNQGNLIAVLAATYWTVLASELVGDKAIYTVASLATRYRPFSVYLGISFAFMGKMLIAVILGQTLLRLPGRLTAAISAAAFFSTAVWLLRMRKVESSSRQLWNASWSNGFAVSFMAIFFSEWLDIGQISAAALAARYGMPLTIWFAASAALLTKGLFALTLGIHLRRYVPPGVLKAIAVGSCGILGATTLRNVFVR